MKLLLLLLLSFSCRTINSRLIEKITDRTLTTEMKTTGSSPPVRLTRDAFGEDSETGGSSKEDHVSSDEQVQPSDNKKPMREFSRIKLRKNEPSKRRLPRESYEKLDKPKKNTTATHQRNEAQTKQKTTLVKKPVPKYNEMDYDDDFQMKISRAPVRTVDSGEHEDEDFNLDDYDFDINHDEFIGRGKPLEPRLKTKVNQASRPAEKHETPRPEAKVQSIVPATLRRPVANKREERRAVQKPAKKAGDKEDYYDDAATSQKTPEKGKVRDSDDEFNDDNEEADEFEAKGRTVRKIRSPWKMNAYIDKFNDKSSSVMSKVLSILPMFPEVPKKTENKKINASINPGP